MRFFAVAPEKAIPTPRLSVGITYHRYCFSWFMLFS